MKCALACHRSITSIASQRIHRSAEYQCHQTRSIFQDTGVSSPKTSVPGIPRWTRDDTFTFGFPTTIGCRLLSMRPNFDCRRTTGDTPAKLIGASITVIGSKAYIFGGRSATDNQALCDLFICDLQDFKWERLHFANVDFTPSARFFHSGDSWEEKLVIFGGYGEHNGLLNDVQIFDPASRRWLSALVLNRRLADPSSLPRPRHSHLSAVCADRLLVIGGEDAKRNWLDDICIYDLKRKAWIQRLSHPRRCVTYAGVATCADLLVRIPSTEHSSVYRTERFSSPPSTPHTTASSAPLHLPYSAEPTDQFPSKVYLYNNESNQHTDPQRSLEVFPPSSTAFVPIESASTINGYPAPPFLRNLTGSIIGTYLIVAGTYFGRNPYYAVWALNLQTMAWTHIDTGSSNVAGSWSRGCLWRDSNKFLVFGDRNGAIAQDHSQRIMNWKDVIVVDLEVFGIYQPPPLALELMTQELCLVALEEAVQTDYQVICDDGRRIKCSRKILEARWPWFREQLSKLLEQVHSAIEISVLSPQQRGQGPVLPENQPDYRLDTRYFDLGEPYPIALALLQYFYTLSLLTPLQQEPAILSRLLELATALELPHLHDLAKHAMHLSLSEKNCAIYEAAVRRRPGCEGLQRRALTILLSKKQGGETSFLDFRDGPLSQPASQPPQLAPLDIPDFFTRPRNQPTSGITQRPAPGRISPIAEDSPSRSTDQSDVELSEYTVTPVTELSIDPRADSLHSSHSDRDQSSGGSGRSGGTQGERTGLFKGLRSVFSPDSIAPRHGNSSGSSSSDLRGPQGRGTHSNVPRTGGGRRAYVHTVPLPSKPPKAEKEKKEGGGGRRSTNVKIPLVKGTTSPSSDHTDDQRVHQEYATVHPNDYLNGNGSNRHSDQRGTPVPRSHAYDDSSSSDMHSISESHAETPVQGRPVNHYSRGTSGTSSYPPSYYD